MAGEVLKGLFGVDPVQAAQEREQQARAQDTLMASRIAALSPTGRTVALGLTAGSQLGRGVGDLTRAGAGMLTGQDLRPENERFAELAQSLAPQLADMGPEQQMQMLSQYALKANMAGSGMALSQGAYQQRMAALKAALEGDKLRAEALRQRAAALKDSREQPLINKLDASKFTPESLAKFVETENYADLKPVTGVVPPMLSQLFERFKRGEELTPTETATLAALGKEAWGADFMNSQLNPETRKTALQRDAEAYAELRAKADAGTITPKEATQLAVFEAKDQRFQALTENESKTILFTGRAERELARAMSSWGDVFAGKANPPVALNSIQSAINRWFQTNPNVPLSADMLLSSMSLRDPKQQQYLSDMIAVGYPMLRLETGAAISQQEWMTLVNSMIPLAGDTEDNKKNKLGRMMDQVKSLKQSAMLIPQYSRVNKQEAPAAPKPATGGDKPKLKWGDL